MVHLVIGGTGFIGPYVVKELLDHGDEVIVADWLPDPTGLGHLGLDKKVKVVRADILDYQNLLGVMKDNQITHIANLANARELSKMEPKEQRAARGGGWMGIRVNIEGTRNVLEAARILDINRVVFISSTGVYGNLPPLGRPLNEDDPTAPVLSGYVAKRIGEMLCEEYNELYDLDCLTVRFGGQVYGPRLFRERSGQKALYPDRLFDAIVDLFENGALGRNCRVTEPNYLKSWLYVKDAASSVYSGFNAQNPKHRLFTAAGFVHTNREIAEMVKKCVKDCKVEYVESSMDRWDKRIQPGWKHAYDVTRTRSELGWEPKWDIEMAVLEWVNYQRTLAGLPTV